jgi:Metallo-peptidase family M12/Putative metal-binding motif
MRYLLIATLLFCNCLLKAQSELAKLDLFVPYSMEKDQNLKDSTTTYFTIDQSIKDGLYKAYPQSLDLVVPGKGSVVRMKSIQLFSKNFKITTDDKRVFYPQSFYRVYQSIMDDEIHTLVLMADEVAFFYSDKNGNHELTRSSNGIYKHTVSLIHLDEDTGCEVIESRDDDRSNPSPTRSTFNNECVDVYFEIDNAQYNKTKGSNPAQYIQSTTNWLVSLVAQVNIQYNRVGIPLKISGVKIYTNLDPYSVHTTSSSTLYAFADSMNRQGFNGRLAHLLVGRGIGGGVAFLNALCSNFSNTAVSGNLNAGVTGYPSYSWNVMVVAHELGHNFGSNHTHDCVWNGNNTAIDGCQNPSGCPDIPNPAQGGTIMSYCHLQSVGINLALGFGPQPGTLIFNRFENALCNLSTDCSATPPINDICITAKNLPPNRTCLAYAADNLDATPSAGISNTACVEGSTFKDVWFTSTVSNAGNLVIETTQVASGMQDMVIEIYTGNCDALTYYTCDDNSGDGDHAKVTINDIDLANDVIYIRVIEKIDGTGKFGVCITSADLPCDTITANKLEDFYNALDGANWTQNSGWVNAASGNCDFCTWHGVYCNYLGLVDSIVLANNNVSDTLLASLQLPISLKKLDLSDNVIEGKLPSQWLSLSKLVELDLSNNMLNDTIPNLYIRYKNLQKIDLHGNAFHGYLPPNTAYISGFNYFDVSNNNLTGCFEPSLLTMQNEYLNLTGNAGLPVSGSTTLFFIDSTGNDNDFDHHCFKMNDCDDFSNTVYEGAMELCDLIDNDCDTLVDEGLAMENKFILANGNWNNDAAWSLGHKPKVCENVVIGDGTGSYLSEISTQSSFNVKSLLVHANSEVKVNTNGYLTVRAGNIVNQGTIKNFGYLSLYVYNATKPDTAFINSGIFSNELNAGLYFNNFLKIGILNNSMGTITNNGNVSLGLYETPLVHYGLVNKGLINNFGSININGNALHEFIRLDDDAVLNTKVTGKINLGRSSVGVGGN